MDNLITDLTLSESFTNNHEKIINVKPLELDLARYNSLEQSVKSGKNIPIEIVFADGSSIKAIYSKQSPQELQTQLNAIQRCDEFGIRHLNVIGFSNVPEKCYMITEFIDNLTPLNTISFPVKAMFEYDVKNVISLIDKLHNAGIFHGDLEPLNIGLTEAGYLVYDFTVSEIYPPGTLPEEKRVRDWRQFTDKLVRVAEYNRSGTKSITFAEIKEVLVQYGLDVYVPHLFKN